MNNSKVNIINYLSTHNNVCAEDLTAYYGIKTTTARQYLSEISRKGDLVRISRGTYAVSQKQNFVFVPNKISQSIYKQLSNQLPYNDLCVYDGSVFSQFQYHLFTNNAVYVETNRDSVEYVFNYLKSKYNNTFRQPDANFMTDYVDLRKRCIIVKSLVTESPLAEYDGVRVPTLEKLLVDIQKDADFDYLRGTESLYIYQSAFELYNINTQRLLRYAKRRGTLTSVESLINEVKK